MVVQPAYRVESGINSPSSSAFSALMETIEELLVSQEGPLEVKERFLLKYALYTSYFRKVLLEEGFDSAYRIFLNPRSGRLELEVKEGEQYGFSRKQLETINFLITRSFKATDMYKLEKLIAEIEERLGDNVYELEKLIAEIEEQLSDEDEKS